MEIEKCPKFESCSANLCPLDPELESRDYLDGEAVCLFVREFVKGSTLPVEPEDTVIFETIKHRYQTLVNVGDKIYEKQLARAASSGSKRQQAKKLSRMTPGNTPESDLKGVRSEGKAIDEYLGSQ